jgi:hypothetical protein
MIPDVLLSAQAWHQTREILFLASKFLEEVPKEQLIPLLVAS